MLVQRNWPLQRYRQPGGPSISIIGKVCPAFLSGVAANYRLDIDLGNLGFDDLQWNQRTLPHTRALCRKVFPGLG